MPTKRIDPDLIDIRPNKQHEGTWNLYVHGKLCVVAESFAIVDGVRDSLLGRSAAGELHEVARTIEEKELA